MALPLGSIVGPSAPAMPAKPPIRDATAADAIRPRRTNCVARMNPTPFVDLAPHPERERLPDPAPEHLPRTRYGLRVCSPHAIISMIHHYCSLPSAAMIRPYRPQRLLAVVRSLPPLRT